MCYVPSTAPGDLSLSWLDSAARVRLTTADPPMGLAQWAKDQLARIKLILPESDVDADRAQIELRIDGKSTSFHAAQPFYLGPLLVQFQTPDPEM